LILCRRVKKGVSDLSLVQISDIDAVDGPHTVGVGLPRRVGLSRASRTSVDQSIMQGSGLGQEVRDVPVDDGLGVFDGELVQEVSMGLLVRMEGGFHAIPRFGTVLGVLGDELVPDLPSVLMLLVQRSAVSCQGDGHQQDDEASGLQAENPQEFMAEAVRGWLGVGKQRSLRFNGHGFSADFITELGGESMPEVVRLSREIRRCAG
jgi:hypothetical protein